MAGNPPNPTNAVLLERIDAMRCDLIEIKQSQAAHISADQQTREKQLVEQAQVANQAAAAHRRLDVIEPIVIKLQDAINSNNKQMELLNQKLAMILAVMGFIGATVGAWLIAQLLGLVGK